MMNDSRLMKTDEAWQLKKNAVNTNERKFIHTAAEEIPQEPSFQSSEADQVNLQIPQVPASQSDVVDQTEDGEAHKNLILSMIIELYSQRNPYLYDWSLLPLSTSYFVDFAERLSVLM